MNKNIFDREKNDFLMDDDGEKLSFKESNDIYTYLSKECQFTDSFIRDNFYYCICCKILIPHSMDDIINEISRSQGTEQPEPTNNKTEEKDDHLLPCPFCGGKPEWINLAHPSGIPALQCPECQFSMQQDRRDKTIFYWNRRAAAPSGESEAVKALRDIANYFTTSEDSEDWWECVNKLRRMARAGLDSTPSPSSDAVAFELMKFPGKEGSDIHKENDEENIKDLLITGIEEGAEMWKLEYDNCRELLKRLLDLKDLKDNEGKTKEYLELQPVTWEAVRRFLSKYQHQ